MIIANMQCFTAYIVFNCLIQKRALGCILYEMITLEKAFKNLNAISAFQTFEESHMQNVKNAPGLELNPILKW